MAQALHTKSVVDHPDARLDDAGLIAVGSGGLISARTGVMAGPGAASLVTGTSATSPMAYSVAPHHWVTNRGVVSDGVYRGAAETVKTVPTTAAPGSGSRIDVIWVKQNDVTAAVAADTGTSQPLYGCTQGTPGGGVPPTPVGAEELARAVVPAGVTRTDTGVTITQTARLTTTRGGIVPIRTAAELAGLPAYPTAQALELDTGRLRWHDGTRWRHSGDQVVVANAAVREGLAAADLYVGLRVQEADTRRWWAWGGSTPGWEYMGGGAEPTELLAINTQNFNHYSVANPNAATARYESLVISRLPGDGVRISGLIAVTTQTTAGVWYQLVTAPNIPVWARPKRRTIRYYPLNGSQTLGRLDMIPPDGTFGDAAPGSLAWYCPSAVAIGTIMNVDMNYQPNNGL